MFDFFAQNSPIFRIRLAEKREGEEHMQMQSAMHFMQKQNILCAI